MAVADLHLLLPQSPEMCLCHSFGVGLVHLEADWVTTQRLRKVQMCVIVLQRIGINRPCGGDRDELLLCGYKTCFEV